jgi:tetratricopeptide (TPR) repeat protein
MALDEKLNAFDVAINDPENVKYIPHFLVQKAGVLWAYGKIHDASNVMDRCAEEYDTVDSVQHFAGQYLLEFGDFVGAIPYLSRCIELAEASGEVWYLDSAYLFRAYCAARIGNLELARQDLANVDDDDAMHWITAIPAVSRGNIYSMIDR